MLQDKAIIKAVSKILQRSEKQIEINKLLSSFVDIGIIPQINNLNNQILFGRRGTGKTHIFQVLKAEMEQDGYEHERPLLYKPPIICICLIREPALIIHFIERKIGRIQDLPLKVFKQ